VYGFTAPGFKRRANHRLAVGVINVAKFIYISVACWQNCLNQNWSNLVIGYFFISPGLFMFLALFLPFDFM